MTDENKDREQPSLHYEGGVPVLPGPAEREYASRHAEKEEERQYKKDQTAIQRGIFRTQLGLVIFGIIGAGISGYQAYTARISSEQAKRSADAAACALRQNERQFQITSKSNQRQFTDTLNQMKSQIATAQKANDIAGSSLIAQTRPLLGPDGEPFDKKEVSIGTASNPNRIQVTFNVSINNFGHSPASRVGFGQLPTDKARGTEIKQTCNEADMESRSESSAGSLGNTPTHLPRVVTIFPGPPYTLSVNIPDPDSGFEAVCIAYQAAGDEKTMYHTILVYRARIEVAPPPIPQHIINVSLADIETQ